MIAERDFRDDGDAVIALLAVDRDVLIAAFAEVRPREIRCRGTSSLAGRGHPARDREKFADEIDAQADGIDIPGGEGEGQFRARKLGFPD